MHLNASSQRTVTVHLPTGNPGRATLRVGSQTQSITVVSPDSIRVGGLPTAAPPNSTPRITVTTMAGTPIANASVRVGNTTVQTDSNGTARVPLGSGGNTTVHVSAHNQTVTKTVRVSESAQTDVGSRYDGSPEYAECGVVDARSHSPVQSVEHDPRQTSSICRETVTASSDTFRLRPVRPRSKRFEWGGKHRDHTRSTLSPMAAD